MTRANSAALACGLAILSAGATPARAQTVADTVTFLMTNQRVETGNAARDQAAAQAASAAVGRALLATLATLPVSNSSGSFTYRLNPELGTVERADQTFGPFFVERALTIGRGEVSAGITFQHLHLTSLDGKSLTDGTLVTTANQFTDESAPFDVDRLRLNITADVATIYGAIGVTNRLDISAAVPLVSLRLDGQRVDTYRGTAFEEATASATAVGPADALVRLKYLWFENGGTRFATAADIRLPTGREADLLGSGSTSGRITALGSVDGRAWSAHGNVGVSAGGFAREVSYGAALAVAPTRRVTLSGEVLARLSDGVGALTTTSAPHPLLAGVETIRLAVDNSWQQMVSFVPGMKVNVSRTWVLTANVQLPVTHAGLTSSAAPFVGLDYALGSIF